MLTDVAVKNIKYSDKVTIIKDADGLYLRVSKTKKRWQLSFMVNGTLKHFYSPFDYPQMSLADARLWAKKLKAEAKQSNSSTTLRSYIKIYADHLSKNAVSSRTLMKYHQRMNKWVGPYADEEMNKYTPAKILEMLRKPEAEGKYSTTTQVRSFLRNIFLLAKIDGTIISNPCEGLEKVVATGRTVSRAAVIDPYEFGDLLASIKKSKSHKCIKTSLQLSALLFTRPGELRLATWSEFNLDEAIWEIPAARMKMREPLVVPLAKQAVSLLEALKPSNAFDGYIFDMGKGQPFTDATLRKELMNLGYYGAHQTKAPSDAKFHSVHGFRASFRTIADEQLEWRFDIIEQQLAHQVRDANGRAYNRTRHLEKRAKMMQLWADFCDVMSTQDKKLIASFIKQHKGAI